MMLALLGLIWIRAAAQETDVPVFLGEEAAAACVVDLDCAEDYFCSTSEDSEDGGFELIRFGPYGPAGPYGPFDPAVGPIPTADTPARRQYGWGGRGGAGPVNRGGFGALGGLIGGLGQGGFQQRGAATGRIGSIHQPAAIPGIHTPGQTPLVDGETLIDPTATEKQGGIGLGLGINLGGGLGQGQGQGAQGGLGAQQTAVGPYGGRVGGRVGSFWPLGGGYYPGQQNQQNQQNLQNQQNPLNPQNPQLNPQQNTQFNPQNPQFNQQNPQFNQQNPQFNPQNPQFNPQFNPQNLQNPQPTQNPQNPQNPNIDPSSVWPYTPQIPQNPQPTQNPQTPQTPQTPQNPQNPQTPQIPNIAPTVDPNIDPTGDLWPGAWGWNGVPYNAPSIPDATPVQPGSESERVVPMAPATVRTWKSCAPMKVDGESCTVAVPCAPSLQCRADLPNRPEGTCRVVSAPPTPPPKVLCEWDMKVSVSNASALSDVVGAVYNAYKPATRQNTAVELNTVKGFLAAPAEPNGSCCWPIREDVKDKIVLCRGGECAYFTKTENVLQANGRATLVTSTAYSPPEAMDGTTQQAMLMAALPESAPSVMISQADGLVLSSLLLANAMGAGPPVEIQMSPKPGLAGCDNFKQDQLLGADVWTQPQKCPDSPPKNNGIVAKKINAEITCKYDQRCCDNECSWQTVAVANLSPETPSTRTSDSKSTRRWTITTSPAGCPVEDLANAYVDSLVGAGIKLVCWDFDETAMLIHTAGDSFVSFEWLAEQLTSDFLHLSKALFRRGVHQAVVSFNEDGAVVVGGAVVGGVRVIAPVLGHKLPQELMDDTPIFVFNPGLVVGAPPGKTWHLSQASAHFGIVDPNEILLIDDTEDNIPSANEMGIRTAWTGPASGFKYDNFEGLVPLLTSEDVQAMYTANMRLVPTSKPNGKRAKRKARTARLLKAKLEAEAELELAQADQEMASVRVPVPDASVRPQLTPTPPRLRLPRTPDSLSVPEPRVVP